MYTEIRWRYTNEVAMIDNVYKLQRHNIISVQVCMMQ